MSGNATYLAATRLRDQILQGMSSLLDVPVESLRLTEEGLEGADRIIPISRVVDMCFAASHPIQTLATFLGPKGRELHRHLKSDRIFPDFTFGTHLADVEVDLDTGAVQILKYLACHDVGRCINPQSVQGQITGAVAQGIGFAMMERVAFDDGINNSSGFFSYQIPNSMDVPRIQSIALESGSGMGPFGARGIGEPPIGPCAPAIASAIEDAIGTRPTELPMGPERVLACIQQGLANT